MEKTVKAYIVIEIDNNNNEYKFLMPAGVPLGEAYDAAFKVLEHITELASKAAEQSKREEAPKDEKTKE